MCMYLHKHVFRWWGLPTAVFQVVHLSLCPVPSILSALDLTDPTLLSSCSSALLNRALLWMAAMASGCSCLMAWQANLGKEEISQGRAEGRL